MAAKCMKVQQRRLPKPEFRYPPRNLDLGKCITEEVALEGLDGLTLQGLFVRLERRPGFSIPIDSASQIYIWEAIKRLKHVSVYLMEEARPDLILHDRRDHIDERGNMFEPVTAPEDIYEYHPIDDQLTDTRGSCREYYTRRPYNSVARQMHYSKISELYGNRLVLVAPQQIRERIMMPDDSDLDIGELSIIQYCILERVARARYEGEMSRGKVSLATMKIDPKSSFYQRKLLLKKSVMLKQTLSMKYGPTRAAASVSIFHLPKFYTYYETLLKYGISRTIKAIMDTPNQQIEVAHVRAKMGKHQVKNFLSKDCQEIFEQVEIPFHDAHPELYAKELIPEKRMKMTKKTVKYFKLRDPRINHMNFTKFLPKSGEDKDEGDESHTSVIPIRFHTTQNTVLQNVIDTIYNARAHGTSQSELSAIHSLTSLDSRSAVRLLQRHKIVVPVMVDKKKTKVHRHVFYKFKEANQNYQKVHVAEEEPSTITSTQKSVFINLEPECEAYSGEIVWTVPEIDLTINPSMEILPDLNNSMGGPRRSHFQSTTTPKKRRGNSYKEAKDNYLPSMLKLTPEVRNLMEDFLSNCNPDIEELTSILDPNELRFNRAEETDFIPFMDSSKAKCVVYVNSNGWQIILEQADVRPDYGRLPSFASPKNTERGNYVLGHIYKSKVIIGFQQILRKMRTYEASLAAATEVERSDIDRRTAYRILRQLQYNELIQILRVSIQKDDKVKVCAIFAPFSVSIESKLITSSIDHVIRSTIGKSRLSLEERKAKNTRCRLIKKPKRLRVTREQNTTETTRVKARPGTKPGSKILKKVVKGTKFLPKAVVKPNWSDRHYDDKDREALARLKRVRVGWCPEEDRVILTSFLASVLFIPRYNHQKIFMFNSHQIRDVLHLKLEKGRSKTALSIRRRLHFLMRKNAFYSRYRYYLTEALQDNVLYEKHLKKYHTKESSTIFFRISTTRLLDVIHYLQQKFHRLSMDPLEDPLAFDQANSPWSKDNSIFYEDETDTSTVGKSSRRLCYTFEQSPGCVMVDSANTPFDSNSVLVWTARTAILSLVLSGDDVTNVHRFLSSISDDVLSYTINGLRVSGLISWQKQSSRFGPSVFLKRKLNAHLGPDKYHEGCTLLEEFDISMGKNFPSTEPGTIGMLFIISELSSQNLLNFDIKLPDPIITINPEWQSMFQAIVDMDDKGAEALEDDFMDFDNETDDPTYGSSKKRKRSSGNNLFPSPKKSKSELMESKYILSDNVMTADILGEVVTGQNELQEALKTGKTTSSPSKALRLSNKAIRVIRSQINAKESGNFVHRDFFNVNLPDLVIIGDREGYERIINQGATPKLPLREIKNHFIKIISYNRISLTGSGPAGPVMNCPENLGKWHQLYDYILATKEIGVSVPFLMTKFTRKTLSEGLRYLILKNAIFLVGVTHRKFVTVEFVEPWTMPVPHSLDNLLVQRVVFRPWITSTGTPNWALVDQSLSAVLGYMNLHPELSVDNLCDHFLPVLSPVETMILVDALVGLEFFNLYKLENNTSPTAFSPPSTVSKNYMVDTFLDMESLHIELNSLTASKYSKLQELFNSEEHSQKGGVTTYGHCFSLVEAS